MRYFGKPITIIIDGERQVIKGEVINKILYQLDVQTGKNILEFYEDDLDKDIRFITDDEFAFLAAELRDEVYSDSGKIEYQIIKDMFKLKE